MVGYVFIESGPINKARLCGRLYVVAVIKNEGFIRLDSHNPRSTSKILLNATLNTFAPSLDTLAARLRRKYGAGQKLPIGRYVEEHDVGQRLHRNAHKPWLGDVSGSGGGMFEPRNIRSHIASWFTSAGRLLQRMPTLRRHIDEPSVVLVRNVSFVWPRSSSNPELVAHTLPRSGPVISAQPCDLRRANTYAGRGRGDENNDHTSVWEDVFCDVKEEESENVEECVSLIQLFREGDTALKVHVYRVSDHEFDTHQCAKLEITYAMPTCAHEVIAMVNRIISTRLLNDVAEIEFLARRIHDATLPPKTCGYGESNESVGPYMTEMSGDTFAKSAPTTKLNI
ncbi:hypothetical protein ACTXT7_009683 [Hymenolepis weldensis]